MKISTIRNALIKQTIIVGAVIAAAVAPVMYLDSFNEEYDKKIIGVKSQVDSITGELNTLLSQYDNANNGILSYNAIQDKQSQNQLTVSKVALRDAFAEIRKKYSFDKFDVDMSDVKPREGEKYKLSTVFAESSNVNLKLNALSDLDVFLLIQELQNSFSAIKFTSVKITLIKELDNNALLEIKNTGFSPIVSGDIKFTWSGLQNIKAENSELLTEKNAKTPVQMPLRPRLPQ